MRSFVNLHVRSGDADAARRLVGKLRSEGLASYAVMAEPWLSVYDEALEAEEDPSLLNAALQEASRLGRAAAFMVHEDEDLYWALAEEGKLLYAYQAEAGAAPRRRGAPPPWLDEEAVRLAEEGQPKSASVRALAALLEIEPEHALVGFADLLQADEESELSEEVWIFEDEEAFLAMSTPSLKRGDEDVGS